MLADLHRALLLVYRRLPRLLRRWIVRTIAPKYTVGAICVIERPDGKVLLVRQVYRAQWGVPGGLVKRREPPEVAACREVREEVGLRIELVGEPAMVVDEDAQRIDVVYRARPESLAGLEELHPSSPEIERVAWFAPDALPELQFETANALVALARSSRSPQAHPLAAETGWLGRYHDGA